jgi:signal transduction histidine kinase
MRLWLSTAFAVVAAVTAFGVLAVSSARSERAVRDRAEELAAGHVVAASRTLANAEPGTDLDRLTQTIAERRRLALFLFDEDGELLTSPSSYRTRLENIPDWGEALDAGLRGERFIETFGSGRAAVVGIRFAGAEAAALVGYAPRPELATGLGVVHDELVAAALWAFLIGTGVGLVVALLITARLRRIGRAALEIAFGDFDTPLRPRFPDELGALAETVELMRQRLRSSFVLLRSQRDRLELLLERLHDGVITVDRDGRVEFANAQARQLLRGTTLTSGELLPEPWKTFSLRGLAADLYRPEARVTQARIAPDEEHRYALVGIPATDGLESAIVVITDVSEQDRREQAEREFVANAAHELSTPIATINSAYGILQAGAKDLPPDRDRFLAMIGRQLTRLERLARALLVLARAQTREEAPQLAPLAVLPILEAVAEETTPAEGVELTLDCPAELHAYAHPDLLEQIIANLAANAAKQTAHGQIVMRARALADGSLAIEVSDTGPGMSTAQQDRAFDRFYRGRRDSEGFGLGLAIAREATRALDGRIELESIPGKGTTVRVVLRSAGAEAA